MEFNKYHPIVNITYFIAVIGFSCLFMHPAALAVSLISGLAYSIVLNGIKAIRFNLLYILPIGILTAVINPLFSHEGQTVITYFPNGNPLTFEAVIYGIAAAAMLISVISHFACFNKIITSDKIVFLLGKISPAIALILTMVLKFVPQFKAQLKQISIAQKSASNKKGIMQKSKNLIKIISTMVTWSFENAAVTVDSMKSRGYGLKGKTTYSNFKFTLRDIIATIYSITLCIYILIAVFNGAFTFEYYPTFRANQLTPYTLSAFTAYILLLTQPIIIEIWEAAKWKKLKSKI